MRRVYINEKKDNFNILKKVIGIFVRNSEFGYFYLKIVTLSIFFSERVFWPFFIISLVFKALQYN